MKNSFVFLVTIIFYFMSTTCIAETLSVILFQGANKPYTIIKNGQQSGIFIDIFKQLSKVTSYKFIFKGYPAARALQEFDMGRVDIEPGVNEIWRQHVKVKGVFTIPYAYSREVIVFKNKNLIKVNAKKDLYGKRVGVVRGYSYPRFDAAFDEKLITKVKNRSENLLLKQLQADRVKYIFIGERTINYYIQQNPQYKDIIIGDTVSKVVVKLRIIPSKAYVLKALNAGLKILINNGEIKKIYAKYQ